MTIKAETEKKQKTTSWNNTKRDTRHKNLQVAPPQLQQQQLYKYNNNNERQ